MKRRFSPGAPALMLLLAACSANPLDADKEGCIEVNGLGNTCDDGAGNGTQNGAATQTQAKTCEQACDNLAACLDLSQTALKSESGCVDACEIDPQGSTCLAQAGGDCGAVQACLTGGGAGDPSVCAPACANLAACVDLSKTELRDEAHCQDVCEADPQGSTCLSNAGRDCTAVLACVSGGNGGNGGGAGNCTAACSNLAACYDLSQTAYGSEAGCVTACQADPTGSDCVAAARDCSAVATCVSGGGGGGGGGGTTCARACRTIDQCSDGGLAGRGITQAQCEAACEAGELAASVAQCLAGAQDCNSANGCVQ